jgi:hypothetical protein
MSWLCYLETRLYLFPKYVNNGQVPFNMYDLFYSKYSHQHVSACIPTIFRVLLLLQDTNLQIWLTVSSCNDLLVT